MASSERDRQAVDQLNRQAGQIYQQGQYQRAFEVLRQALELAEKRLGPGDLDTGVTLNNMGFLLNSTGHPARARPYYERAVSIFEQVLGPEHPDIVNILDNLATVLQGLGELVDARPYFERALTGLSHVFLNRSTPGKSPPRR